MECGWERDSREAYGTNERKALFLKIRMRERERPNATTINFLKKFYSVCKRMERRYETDVENSNSNNKFGNY